ncbi:MAG: 16S rRNA (guanine(527)-N(7))-methyltransferase RsmG [Phycisphaeraceae bacterium]
MADPRIPQFVSASLERLDIALADAQLTLLADYVDRLLEANQRMNLTAAREPDAAWQRLILDSLTLVAGLESDPAGVQLIDVGTGGGIPGIPLAIARPDIRVTLLDATGKKVRFLQECIDALPLANVRAIQARAEEAGQDPAHREHYDLAVCRAVGTVAEVLEYTLSLVGVRGRVLAMKASQAERELRDATDALAILGGGEVQVVEAYPPDFEQELVVISVLKERPTPPDYPRRPGMAKQSPL